MGSCSTKEVDGQQRPAISASIPDPARLGITAVDYGLEGRLVGENIALLKRPTVDINENTVQTSVNLSPSCKTTLKVEGACVLRIVVSDEELGVCAEKDSASLAVEIEDGFDDTASVISLRIEDGSLYYSDRKWTEWSGNEAVWIQVQVLFGKPSMSVSSADGPLSWHQDCGSNMSVDGGVASAGTTSSTLIGLTEAVRPYVTYDIHWNMGMMLENKLSHEFGFFRIAVLPEVPETSQLREYSIFSETETKQNTWSVCSAVKKFPYSGIISFRIADGQIEHNLALESVSSTTWSPLEINCTGHVFLLFELFFGKVNVMETDRSAGRVKQEVELPAEWWWTARPEEDLQQVALDPEGGEYAEVEGTFLDGFQNYPTSPQPKRIHKIYRVESYALYQMYQFKKASLEKRNPRGHQNEMTLWHGASGAMVQRINRAGFSRDFCDQHANVWGQGVYFATSSGNAGRDSSTRADDSNLRRMYRCRVLTGVCTKAVGTMKSLPTIPGCKWATFDSAVDDFKRPAIFVTFNDYQAYPEYLVEYET